MNTRISPIITAQVARIGKGFEAMRLFSEHIQPFIDPIIGFDHFRMSEITFTAHPHAGFSAVTYMFEDAEGGFSNRDSLGTKIEINPGDLHWTLAGSGIIHEEIPITNGKVSHGLQIFVNLSAQNKYLSPLPLHLNASDIPTFKLDGVRVRVVSGQTHGVVSPLNLPEPFTLLDISLTDSKTFDFPVPPDWSALVYVIAGTVAVKTPEVTNKLMQHQGIAIAAGTDAITLDIVATMDSQVVILAGKALREPLVMSGPFAMNTSAEIKQVALNYHEGKMGVLAPTLASK